MRTTIRIKDDLLKRAKKRAAEEGRTLTSLIEEALADAVTKPTAIRRGRVELPISKATGGILPGIDINRSSELEEAMNEP